ncbi:MAG: AMP-binding protein, partial [Alphaproteobacteria bacterium]|nr:AMP-binding protein [Alphaproteobacteria bacterium]
MAATDPMMRYETWPNLVTMFFEKAAERSGKPFLWAKSGGVYKPLSWGETAARVRALAAELKAQGLRAGDRVVLVSESRPEWLISDMAIMAAGGITVPAYTTNTSDDHLHILGNCGARAAIVSTPDLAARLFPAAQHTNSLDFIIAMEPPHMAQTDGFRLLSWNQALQAGAAEEGAIEELAAGLSRNDTACLIYTSGTGGAPKGVMLSHGAILSNCGSA